AVAKLPRMVLRRPGALTREALLAAVAAASFAAVLLWAGPPGNDIAAHVYQRALFLKHGFVLWNNFWYAGRYSFITYSVLYYPLSALLGIKVLALASVTIAALGARVARCRDRVGDAQRGRADAAVPGERPLPVPPRTAHSLPLVLCARCADDPRSAWRSSAPRPLPRVLPDVRLLLCDPDGA